MRRLIIATALMAVSATAKAQQPVQLPEGPGNKIVAVACTQCHGPQPFVQLRMGESGWRSQVENMVLRGAMIAPSELEVVTNYLATAFGPGVPRPNIPDQKVELAAGPGAHLVEGACTLCHGLNVVVATNRPGDQWRAIINRMTQMGAQLDADSSKEIIAYLQKNYGGPR
jgi:mono/diheme cytochrome c family protein